MKQGLIKKGIVLATDLPEPSVTANSVKIRTAYSCISKGTEMSSVTTSANSILKNAIEKPQQVKQVFNLVKSTGIKKTFQRVSEKLSEPKQSGYSVSGIIEEVGSNVTEFQVGDKVAAAGSGYAYHAEFVVVPSNLVVKCPDDLDLKEASTVTLGAIALHGVRRADLKLGEVCVVFGAGILGLLSAQLLMASGVKVIVIDIDNYRLSLAKKSGVEYALNSNEEDVVKVVKCITHGFGSDAVLFTASTKSSEPISLAFQMTRKKGQVVLVGVSGMEIKREDIYKPEIDLKISSSYGPGRYDRDYEELGFKYPFAYIRWTETRNMEAYLNLLSSKKISISNLISSVHKIDDVTDAFIQLQENPENIIAILKYDYDSKNNISKKFVLHHSEKKKSTVNVALIGCGSFATAMHIPNFLKRKDKFKLKSLYNKTGGKSKYIAEKYNFDYVTSDYDDILSDESINLVFITTQHDTHGEFVLKALKAKKSVFVEKPLAVSQSQLDEIDNFMNSVDSPPLLMVGFNRRFSPLIKEIKKKVDQRVTPLFINYSINAGQIDLNHWVYNQGGRIIGEGCHFIDTVSFLVGKKVLEVTMQKMTFKKSAFYPEDNMSMILKYDDGSVATIQYFSLGSKKLEKERMEVHFEGKSVFMSDYKMLQGFDVKLKKFNLKASNKGHLEELDYLYDSLRNNKEWPIPYNQLIEATQITFL